MGDAACYLVALMIVGLYEKIAHQALGTAFFGAKQMC